METPAPVDPRTLIPQLVAGSPPREADRAATTLAAQAETPEGALAVMQALLEWAGRPDAAQACAQEPAESRKGEALSLLAWALADQQHDDAAERVGKAAVDLGLRRAATDALLLVYGRRGRTAEQDALIARYLDSDHNEGFHALVPVQKAALDAWQARDLLRSTNLSRALVERSPADMDALFRAGYGLYVAGRWTAALELLERYRKWAGNEEDARLPIAGCLYGLGRYDDAMAILGQIVEDAEESVDHTFLAWVQIAWCELGKGLLDRAEGALARARGVLESAGAVDEEALGPGMSDLDAIEGVIDALSNQLDLAHKNLARMRRNGASSAPILEEAIGDVESGRVRPFGVELPRHRRGRPRGSLAERLSSSKPGDVVELENGTWDAGGVELPAGVVLRGQGSDTLLTAVNGPVLVSRGSGGALQKCSVHLTGSVEDHVALLVEGGNLAVSDCLFEAKRGVAASIRGDAKPTFEGVTFRGGLGVSVSDAAAPVVKGGSVSGGAKKFGVLCGGQSAGEWHGVEISLTDWACVRILGTAAPTFSGCKVHGSKLGSGFWLGEDARGVLAGNDIANNKYPGILADDRTKPVIRGNRIHHHACAAIQLAGKTESIVEGNEVSECEAAHVECLHESRGVVKGNRLRGGTGPGIWVLHASSPTVEDNHVEGTKRPGMEVAYSAKPTARRNRIEKTQAAGLRITESAGGTFEAFTIADCGSGIDVGGQATPTIRGARVERSAFAAFVAQGGPTVKIEGLTASGGKVGLDLMGRGAVEASGVRIEGAGACPVQAGGAVRAVLVGATIDAAGAPGPTVSITGGGDLTLRDATVKARTDGPAIAVRGQGIVRIEGGTVQGGRRTPIVATETARVRVRVASITATGGVGIEASGAAGVAVEDARVEGEAVKLRDEASPESWEEPPSPDAHAAVVLLLRAPVDEATVTGALGADGAAEGFVRFSVGRSALSRAALLPYVGQDPAVAGAVRDARAWVSIYRKPGVEQDKEVAEMRKLAHAILRAVRATGALAVWCPRGAQILPASAWSEAKIDGNEVGRLFCSVRSYPVGSNVVVETVGLAAFGQQDVQCESVADHKAVLEPIFASFIDAIVAEPYRYGYRAVTKPVQGSPQTFMVQEGKHDFPPGRKVWLLQPIGDLGAGGGWKKDSKPAWGKPAPKLEKSEPKTKGWPKS